MIFVKHESGSHISNLNASQFPMSTKIKSRLFNDCSGDCIPVDFSNTFPWFLNLYISMDSAKMTYLCPNHNLFFMTLNVMFPPAIGFTSVGASSQTVCSLFLSIPQSSVQDIQKESFLDLWSRLTFFILHSQRRMFLFFMAPTSLHRWL